ncbi:MAG: hydantoinase B/oxoprolinase family protein [Acetobacteraceae bacterium]
MDAEHTTIADPVVTEIVRGALGSIQLEMEALIERTAMSPFIREKKDFHTALFDRDARLIAGKSLPIASNIIEPILERYPAATMRPGDIYWYNDCYASKGAVSHTSDQVFITPVFAGDILFAYAHSWAHFNDIGGMRPGSLSPDCTEIFQEGIIIPPVRLAREGVVSDDLLNLFYRNCRFPEMVRGDTRASLAAIRLGEKRLQELIARFGTKALQAAFDALIDRTREAARAKLRALVPDGDYRFTETVDGDGQGSGAFAIRYHLSVENGRTVLDLTGSDDQVKGPLNFLMSQTTPRLALTSYLVGADPATPVNQGALDLIDEVRLRPGSIVQPRFPAPLGLRGVTMMRNLSGLLGLMNVATNGQAMAAHSAYVIWYLRGRTDDGRIYLMSDGVGVGYGARPFADGNDAIYLVAQENYPVEFLDAVYPVRVREYAINRDTGGPGRWRGGCGMVRELEVLAEEGMVSVRIDSVDNPPWGVAGGHSARSGRCVINPGRNDERVLNPLSDGNLVRRGDIIRVETGGGGGWGHPFDREPERVLADVLGGFVSRDSAERDYGVVLHDDGTAVDLTATQAWRRQRPEAALFHRNLYRASLD